jgi:hypothetical protein
MSDPLKELLDDLHRETILQLLQRVRSGEATAADLNVARAMLKDNHVNALPVPGSPLGNLANELPFTGDEDDGHPLYN